MSEAGWRTFVASDDTADWVVLHGGAAAVFRVQSLRDATHLAQAIAQLPTTSSSGIILTLSENSVNVRLTRDLWRLESEHLQTASAISRIARSFGANADRAAVQEVQVAIAAKSESLDVGFWRAVLGYMSLADDSAADPLGHGSTVWMQTIDQSKALRHAMHIDVSVAREEVQARLTAALSAGGRIVDESHAPSHWTLADRAGNRVCICAWPDGSGSATD